MQRELAQRVKLADFQFSEFCLCLTMPVSTALRHHGAWLHLRSVFAAHPEPAVAALFSSHGQSAAAAGAGEGSVSGPAPVELKDAAKWLYGHALTRDLAVPFSPNAAFKINVAFLSEEQPGEHALLATVEHKLPNAGHKRSKKRFKPSTLLSHGTLAKALPFLAEKAFRKFGLCPPTLTPLTESASERRAREDRRASAREEQRLAAEAKAGAGVPWFAGKPVRGAERKEGKDGKESKDEKDHKQGKQSGNGKPHAAASEHSGVVMRTVSGGSSVTAATARPTPAGAAVSGPGAAAAVGPTAMALDSDLSATASSPSSSARPPPASGSGSGKGDELKDVVMGGMGDSDRAGEGQGGPGEVPRAIMDVVCTHSPVLVSGCYLKYDRELPQSPWVIDGERNSATSVEEDIARHILPHFRSQESKFHSSGREDMDVRMLGTGRPFVLELLQPHRVVTDPDKFKAIQDEVNRNTRLIEIHSLQLASPAAFEQMKKEVNSKKKSYRCVVWVSRALRGPGELAAIAALKDLAIDQKTPIRVLHRRSALVRRRVIHSFAVEFINPHFFLLDILTSSGTYVKEFVHGDRGRTTPSIGSLLGCQADILQLDVTGLFS